MQEKVRGARHVGGEEEPGMIAIKIRTCEKF